MNESRSVSPLHDSRGKIISSEMCFGGRRTTNTFNLSRRDGSMELEKDRYRRYKYDLIKEREENIINNLLHKQEETESILRVLKKWYHYIILWIEIRKVITNKMNEKIESNRNKEDRAKNHLVEAEVERKLFIIKLIVS